MRYSQCVPLFMLRALCAAETNHTLHAQDYVTYVYCLVQNNACRDLVHHSTTNTTWLYELARVAYQLGDSSAASILSKCVQHGGGANCRELYKV